MTEAQPDLLSWRPRYPDTPGYKRSGTSQEAAESIAERMPNMRRMVFEALKLRDMTADEVASALNLSVLQTRPRLSELLAYDKIRDTGIRRKNASGKNAVVWAVIS